MSADKILKNQPIEPFLKWAGGKRWLARRLNVGDWKYAGRYIEPFLGSAAIYFSLAPKRAVLSDVNESLIETYRAIRDAPREVSRILVEHHAAHSKKYYYEMRGSSAQTTTERAARFIYLNRTCWNGLYRVNKKGVFNVPKGTKSSVILPTDDWMRAADALSNAQLRVCDFEDSIDAAVEGDLLFVDPPYTVKHNFNGFLKYNECLFSWGDQVRLQASLARAVGRGVTVVATNADHESVRELYRDGFILERLERSSVLSGDPAFRGRYSELLITANSQ